MKNLRTWAAARRWQPIEIDCITTVMLKILDGKCKMNAAEKTAMSVLYDGLRCRNGMLLGAQAHSLIAEARHGAGEALRMQIYEMRLLAETMISRPVMKGFKAMLRAEGAFADG
ncbi:MAG: hypothetical protein COS82_00890 [Zetaproteobacteria bacterium CG06_land_8_20_14_3_00_59_53]|nr:MAG: hypothetical protein AUK36_05635 [Zetaproteobacteria bacterium CG2_30_59_37]PIO90536.1 MAG: hypothetical protein COX56_01945 [Zetaproteobacteria bacterium CG23_combo_of_CG06-09_8_20_14_all_59_86]PIQ66005.1 MAG: hypothetical protein COV97_01505 [Zetaproteobacteria bacterium CG11_big_fil_rev_8_21_14_0_20_59_439]PIU71485.1 MAG: hypothetical protein COS82_00890 [Zetaproteobacteria bacterium CG06_land_8_20_14_3_00_59_53]PIU97743.1 MAG: hypothetical protein COS62_01870 [Zetaproteobacteria bac